MDLLTRHLQGELRNSRGWITQPSWVKLAVGNSVCGEVHSCTGLDFDLLSRGNRYGAADNNFVTYHSLNCFIVALLQRNCCPKFADRGLFNLRVYNVIR